MAFVCEKVPHSNTNFVTRINWQSNQPVTTLNVEISKLSVWQGAGKMQLATTSGSSNCCRRRASVINRKFTLSVTVRLRTVCWLCYFAGPLVSCTNRRSCYYRARWLEDFMLLTCTVIPRLTKIIRSGIAFVSRNVISRRFL